MNLPLPHAIFLRRVLAPAIVLAGLALIPFVNLPAAIGWEQLASVYQPVLDAEVTSGPAGTTFTFAGTNYPPSSLATIYVNGQPSGTVTTDEDGQATFVLNTDGIPAGTYNVTLEVDVNASATQSITLLPAASPTPPPSPTAVPQPSLTPPPAEEVVAAPTAAAQDDQTTGDGQTGSQSAGLPAERMFGAWLLIIGGLALAGVLIWALARRLRN
jgi:hypothetical protein